LKKGSKKFCKNLYKWLFLQVFCVKIKSKTKIKFLAEAKNAE